jgi:hypothetical protein
LSGIEICCHWMSERNAVEERSHQALARDVRIQPIH